VSDTEILEAIRVSEKVEKPLQKAAP
jgi:hypothetical protein